MYLFHSALLFYSPLPRKKHAPHLGNSVENQNVVKIALRIRSTFSFPHLYFFPKMIAQNDTVTLFIVEIVRSRASPICFRTSAVSGLSYTSTAPHEGGTFIYDSEWADFLADAQQHMWLGTRLFRAIHKRAETEKGTIRSRTQKEATRARERRVPSCQPHVASNHIHILPR